MFQPTKFTVDHDRFFYEPRALWSSARVGTALQPATQSHPAGFVQLPKEDFKNPSRFPIRLTHAIVSPIGYLFRSFTAPTIAPLPQFDAAMAGIGRMRMVIQFPKRAAIERNNTDVYSFASRPTAEPSFDDDALLDHASGLFGISRWNFDVPYIVPRKASIEIILSTIGAFNNVEQLDIPSTVIVHERGGRMLGHGRSREPLPLEYAPPTSGSPQAWPTSRYPVMPDFFALNAGGAGPQGQTFPPSGKWPSSDYNKQLGARGLPYTELEGFAVAIDQIDFDDAVEALGIVTAPRLAPISQRIITKASTRDAGTGEQWWRDGAPLSLVTPTMTPGFVHELAQPFELGPGEGIEVALQAPAPRVIGATTVQSAYNVGVSFCGYAVVQDNNRKVFR